MLSLIAPALATTTGMGAADVATTPGCPPPVLVGTVPDSGSTDVPVNQPLMLLFDGGTCGDRIQFLLEDPLGLVDEGDLYGEVWLNGGKLYRLDFGLVPGTDYVLTVTPEYTGEAVEIAFSTGTGAAVLPDVDGLSLDLDVSDVVRSGRGRLDVFGVATVRAPADTLVRLAASEGAGTSTAWISTGEPVEVDVRVTTSPGEACVEARAEDAWGTAGDWITACQPVEATVRAEEDGEDDDAPEPYTPSRCQTAPTPAGGALLLPLALIARRRHR